LHPVQNKITFWFRGSRTWAAITVSILLTVLIATPLTFIGLSLAEDAKELGETSKKWAMSISEIPPSWLNQLPVFKDEAVLYWDTLIDTRNHWIEQLEQATKQEKPEIPKAAILNPELAAPLTEAEVAELKILEKKAQLDGENKVNMANTVAIWINRIRIQLVSLGLAVGNGVLQLILIAFFLFFLLRDGVELSQRLKVSLFKIAGDKSTYLINIVGNTVKGVIYGILGTSFAQSILAGIGFVITGVPGAGLLAVLTFFFSVIPFGPPLIWLPACTWLYAQNMNQQAIILFFWGLLIVSGIDNIMRPFLISQGSKTPFAVVFCGVVGGVLAFGLVGIFIGPVLLALVFRLLREWTNPPTEETNNQSELCI
jgi:predicted PurR-regulated permease PerM